MEAIITSLELADYIRQLSREEYRTELNMTQVNKLLYICYGLYIAITGQPLFTDDTPKAWPFGPVFPRVYKRFLSSSGVASQRTKEAVVGNPMVKSVVDFTVKNFHSWTAKRLSEWSHDEAGPWYRTAYANGGEKPRWNERIPDEMIREYFGTNRKGDGGQVQ